MSGMALMRAGRGECVATKTPYLERYLAGEYEPVWAELIALGDHVRKEPRGR